jgi:uncharacterized protein
MSRAALKTRDSDTSSKRTQRKPPTARNGRIRARIDRRFTRFRLRVSRSQIDHRGVFAAEDIPGGRKVIEYTGERITVRQALRRFNKILRSGKPKRFYFFALNRRVVIDGAVSGSGAELINHSCDPNLSKRALRGHILYFSRRRIRRGEELTYDYRSSRRTVRIPCNCGSVLCRGTINER